MFAPSVGLTNSMNELELHSGKMNFKSVAKVLNLAQTRRKRMNKFAANESWPNFAVI